MTNTEAALDICIIRCLASHQVLGTPSKVLPIPFYNKSLGHRAAMETSTGTGRGLGEMETLRELQAVGSILTYQ